VWFWIFSQVVFKGQDVRTHVFALVFIALKVVMKYQKNFTNRIMQSKRIMQSLILKTPHLNKLFLYRKKGISFPECFSTKRSLSK